MIIKYLLKVSQNPKLDGFKNSPLSIEEIEKLKKNTIKEKNFLKLLENIYFLLEILIILPLMI
ncbi:hypothetical protein [Paenimyroides baculatum]|uniref:Uncharacterized protein n=1 Tax=Paenimyroides baculatum TaxID=2608000 RepID=A0A5M6CFS9_9FLAO|nr:hypothetical protein [Paenimyroides baculatum]KAA5533896.1 hypothetical protein F0460_11215 [Paenimyroides baculatum]